MSAAALRDYEPWRVRNRCFVQADLTAAHPLGGDLEQAAVLGRDELRTAADASHLARFRLSRRWGRPL
ncbi:MAG: hypothetical protein ACRDQX_12210 [Pseudonocardiaceae bacterium]